MDVLHTALAVFVLTYFLISARHLPRIRMERSTAALLGAALMVIVGATTVSGALRSIDVEVLMLLLGMMLLVSSLQTCGLFRIISEWMVRRSTTPLRFFTLICVVTASLSALVLNDAVVLLLTPVIIETCYRLRLKPFPFLMGHVMAANIGSVATVVGNPQNAYIATQAGIGFLDFSYRLLPAAAVCLTVMIAMMAVIFRKDLLGGSLEAPDPSVMASFDHAEVEGRVRGQLLRRGSNLRLLLLVTAATVAAFTASNAIGLPLGHIAIIAGSVAALLTALLTDVRPREISSGVDWSILLFFIGLFVVIQGAVDSGLMQAMEVGLFTNTPLESGSGSSMAVLVALLSNLVSNVPAVLLVVGLMPVTGDMWYSLAAVSTLAGNATIIASAVNIIMAERAERLGVRIEFWRFMAAGLPVAVVTTLIAYGLLTLL